MVNINIASQVSHGSKFKGKKVLFTEKKLETWQYQLSLALFTTGMKTNYVVINDFSQIICSIDGM